MAYLDEAPAMYQRPPCLAEVWTDPDDWKSRQVVMDVDSLVRVCGPKTLGVIRDAAYSLPKGSDVAGVFSSLSAELARHGYPAGFVSATPSEGRVTVGLPGEPAVSVRVDLMDRDLSLRILTAEVMCA